MTAEERARQIVRGWALSDGALTAGDIRSQLAEAIRAVQDEARREEREVCAKIAEEIALDKPGTHEDVNFYGAGFDCGCYEAAAAIRGQGD